MVRKMSPAIVYVILNNGRILKHGTPAEIESDAEVQVIYMGGSRGGSHAA